MQNILACIDASSYALSVCDLAGWASRKLDLPVELLHVVQRKDVTGVRQDLSGAIGLGVKSRLLEELTQLDAAEARLQIERGRLLLEAATERARAAGASDVTSLHRHGGIVETILEREREAHLVVMGKRGASQGYAQAHLGSKLERVVRASHRPVMVAPEACEPPRAIVLAYDGSPAAGRALERCANSPRLQDLPVTIVVAGRQNDTNRALASDARKALPNRQVTEILEDGRAEELICRVMTETPHAMLVMGAFGHSPLRTLMVGSTTTAMVRSVQAPLLLVR